MRAPGRESKNLAGAALRGIGLEARLEGSRPGAGGGGKRREAAGGGGRGEMDQVVTPEEMGALLEGLREAAGGPGSLDCQAPPEIVSRDRVFPEGCRITNFQKLSDWLMALADLRWPHL